ncbi:MAG: hypothetical protein AB2807_09215, partial [Candidatus Sedimenticola endophacoides]
LAGEEAVSLLAAGHFFHWIKLCTYELNSGTKKTGIQCGDATATLSGKTLGGLSFTGTDRIKTVGCKSWSALHIEAESFSGGRPAKKHEWIFTNSIPGFSGSGAMHVLPDDFGIHVDNYVARSPRLDYQVYFPKAGTYYIWVRGMAFSGHSNSVHAGINGRGVKTAKYIRGFKPFNEWVWANKWRKRIKVPSAGYHTVNLWMRESGFVVDKLILTKDKNFAPN